MEIFIRVYHFTNIIATGLYFGMSYHPYISVDVENAGSFQDINWPVVMETADGAMYRIF